MHVSFLLTLSSVSRIIEINKNTISMENTIYGYINWNTWRANINHHPLHKKYDFPNRLIPPACFVSVSKVSGSIFLNCPKVPKDSKQKTLRKNRTVGIWVSDTCLKSIDDRQMFDPVTRPPTKRPCYIDVEQNWKWSIQVLPRLANIYESLKYLYLSLWVVKKLQDRIRNKNMHWMVGLGPVEDKMKINRLRLFGHVYRKSAEVVRWSEIITIDGSTKGKSTPKLTSPQH